MPDPDLLMDLIEPLFTGDVTARTKLAPRSRAAAKKRW